jgi:uncharacterized protein DUF2252
MMAPGTLKLYAGFCGWTLARAHARSGDAVTMAQYLGKTDEFDQAITEAISSGRLDAVEGL